MTRRSSLGGLRATTSIINAHSSGGTSSSNLSPAFALAGREVLSGPLTAGVLATIINVPSGAGVVPLLTAYAKDATSRTVRLKVTVDGIVVFNPTSNVVTAINTGVYAAGAPASTNYFIPSEPIVFLSSLLVEVASSLSETDKIGICYLMHRTT